MFGKIKSLVKDSALYGVGTILTRAVAFLLLPYYSHLMTPAEYGVYTLFMILVAVAQPFYIQGMDIAFLRFTADASREEQDRNLGAVLTHTFLFGGVLTALLFLFAEPVAQVVVKDSQGIDIRRMAQLAAGIMLLDTMGFHIYSFLRIQHRAMMFSMLKLSNVLVNIGLNIYLVGALHMGALGAFWAFFLTSALTLLALVIIVFKHIRITWSWERVKPWLIFGLPNLPSMLFFYAVEFSDRKWVEVLMGVDEAGIYAAGYRVGMLMNMVAQAFRFAWQPFFLQTEKDLDSREVFARVLTYYMAFTSLIWLGASLMLGDLLKLPIPGVGAIIAQPYWAGLQVIPIIMLAHIFNGVYANFMVGVYVQKRTFIIPIVIGSAAIVNITGNYFLIPIYGYIASAWLTVLSFVMMAGLMFLYIAPKYPVPYEWKRIGRIVMTTAAAYGVAITVEDALLDSHSSTGTVLAVIWLVRIAVVVVLPVIWWSYIAAEDEKAAIRRKVG